MEPTQPVPRCSCFWRGTKQQLMQGSQPYASSPVLASSTPPCRYLPVAPIQLVPLPRWLVEWAGLLELWSHSSSSCPGQLPVAPWFPAGGSSPAPWPRAAPVPGSGTQSPSSQLGVGNGIAQPGGRAGVWSCLGAILFGQNRPQGGKPGGFSAALLRDVQRRALVFTASAGAGPSPAQPPPQRCAPEPAASWDQVASSFLTSPQPKLAPSPFLPGAAIQAGCVGAAGPRGGRSTGASTRVEGIPTLPLPTPERSRRFRHRGRREGAGTCPRLPLSGESRSPGPRGRCCFRSCILSSPGDFSWPAVLPPRLLWGELGARSASDSRGLGYLASLCLALPALEPQAPGTGSWFCFGSCPSWPRSTPGPLEGKQPGEKDSVATDASRGTPPHSKGSGGGRWQG